MKKIPELNIGNLIAKLPIIQGGMGVGISMAGLAAAVANEGGIGVISSVGLGMTNSGIKSAHFREANKSALRAEIRKARELTSGIIGVNIMVALTDYEDLVFTALEEKIDILFLGAGLPIKFNKIPMEFLKKIKTKIIPIVSSSRVANLIFNIWDKKFNRIPDAVVVEGPKAGGHLGFKKENIDIEEFQLERIVPDVVEKLHNFEEKYQTKIPVIAAGGIFTGEDIAKFIKIGASGVQMGTRFVATNECEADSKFKDEYIRSRKEDIVIIESPVGLPGRAISNNFLKDVANGIKKPFTCEWQCLKTCNFKSTLYCIAKALTNAKMGNLNEGFCFAGANAYKIDKIISVSELMQILKDEYEQLEDILVPKLTFC